MQRDGCLVTTKTQPKTEQGPGRLSCERNKKGGMAVAEQAALASEPSRPGSSSGAEAQAFVTRKELATEVAVEASST